MSSWAPLLWWCRLGTWPLRFGVAAVNSRTGDAHVADVLARGRESYFKLSPADRITFGYYMQERLLMYESSLAMAHLLKPTVLDVVQKNIRFHLSFPGVREWWTEPGRELLAQDFEDEVGRLAGIDRPRAVEDAVGLGAT